MFSGIVERTAPVLAARGLDGSLEIEIDTGLADLALGESLAVDGVCLTVAAFDPNGRARLFISPETLVRSNLGRLSAGVSVNLERAVTLDTRLSGHLVQGHVDGIARLTERVEDQGAYRHRFSLPAALGRYCVEKGSIALNGISLTINAVEPEGDRTVISVTVIPHTWNHTTLHAAAIGDPLNLEVDVMAKYVERLCLPYIKP
jgi:riboflavin synthase